MSNLITLLVVITGSLSITAVLVRHQRIRAAVLSRRSRPRLATMSRRSDYFALGTGFLVVIGILVSLTGNFYNAAQANTPARPYSFWTAPEMDACYVLLPIAIYLYVAGFANLHFPPWARPGFPNLEIEITQIRQKGHPLGDGSNLWIALYLRVSSREADRNASVSLRYRAKLDPDTERGEKFGETIFLGDVSKDRPDDFPTDCLAQPINILPQHSYGATTWRRSIVRGAALWLSRKNIVSWLRTTTQTAR